MKSSMTKLRDLMIIGCSVVGFIFNGCQLNDATGPVNKNQQPEIPPASTLVMDFGDFTSSGQSDQVMAGTSKTDHILSRDNWNWAATNVLVWNTLLTVAMVTPVSAFIESFKHEPVQQPDESWVWSYDFYVLNVKHTAALHAKTISSGIRWDMYISKENSFSDYHWFFGESNLVSTKGFWTLNASVGATPFLSIEWNRNPQEGTSDIKYMNVIPNHPENGGYISYAVTTNSPYDAVYDVYNKGKDNHTNIEWNRVTTEGRVKDPLRFGDGAWHCWDVTLQDVDCK